LVEIDRHSLFSSPCSVIPRTVRGHDEDPPDEQDEPATGRP
jgi:hypothetical protein